MGGGPVGSFLNVLRSRERRSLVPVLIGTVVCALLGAVSWPIAASPSPFVAPILSLQRLEYDVWSGLRLRTDSDPWIEFVGFDTSTEFALGQKWPPSRKVFAQAIRNLKNDGAETIVVDVLFEGPTKPEDDKALHLALAEAGNVVLAARMDRDPSPGIRKKALVMPYASDDSTIDFSQHARIGMVEVPVDEDGIVRRMVPYAWFFDEPVSSLALAAFSDEKPKVVDGVLHVGERVLRTDGPVALDPVDGSPIPSRDVNFSGGYTGQEPAGDLAQIAKGTFPAGTFTGKVVFIGLTGFEQTKELNDSYLLPTHRFQSRLVGGAVRRHVPGVALQAMLLESLKRPELRVVPLWLRLILSALLGALMVRAGQRWGDWRGLAGALALAASALIGSLVAFLAFSWIMPMAPVVAAGLFLSVSVSWLERSALRKRWARYVSPRVFQLIAASDDAMLSRRCHATVLFVDIRGFTRFAAGQTPTHVMELLNRHFELILPAITRYDGTVDKFAGDGLIAVFGAPIESPDSALQAARAALEIQATPSEFELGLGMATGELVAGHVGGRGRFDFTLVGDAANYASRLQSLTSQSEIRIDQATAQAIRNEFHLEECEPVAIKGFDEPQITYRLIGPISRA